MSMIHKAFPFDWRAFETELAPILRESLASNEPILLTAFVERDRAKFTDPYDGNPLSADWRARLEIGDLQEIADVALTRFYRLSDEFGIGASWLSVTDSLTQWEGAALLGASFGPPNHLFDPGRMGSYFQTPSVVKTSIEALANATDVEIVRFRASLENCAAKGCGVYVTF